MASHVDEINEINEIERDPQFWRELAEETRAMAKGLRDPEAVRAVLRVVEEYEHLAELAAAGSPGRPGDARRIASISE
jgi:hypothetical protein